MTYHSPVVALTRLFPLSFPLLVPVDDMNECTIVRAFKRILSDEQTRLV
jgi:hypothetical protein